MCIQNYDYKKIKWTKLVGYQYVGMYALLPCWPLFHGKITQPWKLASHDQHRTMQLLATLLICSCLWLNTCSCRESTIAEFKSFVEFDVGNVPIQIVARFECQSVDKFTCTSLIVVIVEENIQQPCPFCLCSYVSFYKNVCKEGHDQCIFTIFSAWF